MMNTSVPGKSGRPGPRWVVLFDIDGTLVANGSDGPSAGLVAMNRATHAVTGVRDACANVDFAGRTDRGIARMSLLAAGESAPLGPQIDALIAHYLQFLAEEITTKPYRPLGTPRSAVPALQAAGAIVGLGTGNVRAGGAAKLINAGIAELFDLDRGGFGDDSEDRAELLAIGALRCDPSGELPVVVVGDTPRDVAAARAIGAKCIGVPFWRNTASMLADAGADAVVDGVGPELVELVRHLGEAP